ncbi:hypothetical protein RAZWK3B_00805 [Roseobacter sp. AzwK-3b]|uniref:hypothetical protein n=1 Tax=Roseobacter sp. AzwK-3b TaxID=351016 RepID=UPI000156969F|nr:hypothetical protein [Roseobacter sp. AzwK-3b]EDM72715.1 hypothetical protein RAZWK3B_00805 [Roseobacter sp. AzwK-3b]
MTPQKRIPLPLLGAATGLILASLATGAQAACYVEFKAKKDNPLQLFHEVVQIQGPCTQANARAQLQQRLAQQGITLLKVMSVRDE